MNADKKGTGALREGGAGMEWGPKEFQECLADLRPKVGNYGWMWAVLRARARKTGRLPTRLYAKLKRFFRPERPYFVARTADGTAFMGDYRDDYATLCAILPEHDAELVCFMKQRMEGRAGCYVDVGTNLGLTAAQMARFLEGRADVVAFEPVPETARRAAATFALNGLRNVRLFPAAVGDRDGEITFFATPGHSAWASVYAADQGKGFDWRETKVRCWTLDTLAEEGKLNRVGLIKLDVEGHELQAVQGARQLVARDRPAVLYEYNYDLASAAGWGAEDVAAVIRSAGGEYEFHVLSGGEATGRFPPPAGGGGYVNVYGEALRATGY